jgi:hypothetical protein
MSRHKKHPGPAPVPPGNRPQGAPADVTAESQEPDRHQPTDGAGFGEQDPQRRLGGFEGAGEHSRQQPGRANDGDTHSR